MDPFTIVPGHPVADHEVRICKPVQSNHRRHRHAPLLQATEWMKVVYHQRSHQPLCKDESEIVGEGGAGASLPLGEVAVLTSLTSAKRRRGIYTPQALRPNSSAGKRAMSEAQFQNFLEQLKCSPKLEGEEDPSTDGEVSPVDIPSSSLAAVANREGKRKPFSNVSPDFMRPGTPAENFLDVAETVIVVPFNSLPAKAVEKGDENTPISKATSKDLPAVPVSEGEKSTEKTRIVRKPLPASTDKTVKAVPSSAQVMDMVSAMANIERGAEFPRIDYGPVGKHTALQSHRPTAEEREHSLWLSEGWKLFRSKKSLDGVYGSRADGGKRSRAQAVFRGAVKGLFTCG